MNLLQAVLLEMERLDLDSADGINVLELIDRYNLEVDGAMAFDDLMAPWRETNKI
tara:strand:- start:858 stop:1022 length:165 start_codon:yes stop_codon:yes gene_type:complete